MSLLLRWTTLAVLIFGVALLLASCNGKREVLAVTAPRPAPEPLRWVLKGAEGEHLKDWEGTYLNGETLFIPAGAQFSLSSQCEEQPQFASGPEFTYWTSQGGRCEHDSVTGERWKIQAPNIPGLYQLRWKSPSAEAWNRGATKNGAQPAVAPSNIPDPLAGVLHVAVLAKAELRTRGGRTQLKAQGRSLGEYLDPTQAPTESVRNNAGRYQPPQYFALLEKALDLPLYPDLSKNLTLGQMVAFMEKRDDEGRKIILPDRHTDVLPPCRPLYEKLYKLRERLVQKGVKVTRFWITSGFRTPEYNKRIGGAAYSRHCFGDAVDLCIDEDGDLHMDDLNHDGKIDRHDGILIALACLELEKEGAVVPGGIGVYEWDGEHSVKSHVHIDCRGFPSRWGQGYQGGRKVNVNWWGKLDPGAGDGGGD